MQQTDFDLLIIGGGINGCGIARDAARRGLSVLLVEQGDLAQHTSSASTKLIHGGLRYLEYFEFGLVRSALLERERLLGIAPHLVKPLEFVLPQTNSPRSAWMIQLGLALYDRLGGRTSLPRSARVDFAHAHYGAGLQSDISHGFSYSDCWVDDSRLVILNALDARECGAEIRSRTRFVHASRDRNEWRCTLSDTVTGESSTVTASALVNAGGPWVADILANRVNVQRPKTVRLVKGSHIVVSRLHEGSHAFMLQNPDRRIVFVIPYEDHYSLIGTTEVAIDGPDHPATISPEEINYLCASTNRYFIRKLTRSDVVWSFSGTRPLFEDAAKNATAVTRDYVLDIDTAHNEAPLLSVFGGKITTYRKLAEQALNKLAKFFPDAERTTTGEVPLPGAEFCPMPFGDFIAQTQRRYPFIPEQLLLRWCRSYGARLSQIVGDAMALAELGEHFGAGLYESEVRYLIENEFARTTEDILLRRSKLVLHMQPEDVARLREHITMRKLTRIAERELTPSLMEELEEEEGAGKSRGQSRRKRTRH